MEVHKVDVPSLRRSEDFGSATGGRHLPAKDRWRFFGDVSKNAVGASWAVPFISFALFTNSTCTNIIKYVHMARAGKAAYFRGMGRPPKTNLPEDLKQTLSVIGANIRSIRERQGMSQIELARRSKISATTLNELEFHGFRDIRLSTLVALAQALKVPLAALFFQSDLELNEPSDHAQLLKASDTILQITKKLKSRTKPKA